MYFRNVSSILKFSFAFLSQIFDKGGKYYFDDCFSSTFEMRYIFSNFQFFE